MIKGVIFDFDGLILDTETAWYHAFKKVLQSQFQFELPLEEFVKSVGSDDKQFYPYLQKELGSQLNIEDIQYQAAALHTQYIRNENAREGVSEYLRDAKDAGLGVALATSSDTSWATTHLNNLSLLSYFDYVVTKDMVDRVKPAPDLFIKALEKLELASHEAIVFEDSLNGLIAAQEINIPTVIVPNPVTASLPFENYHLRLNSMMDMPLQEVIHSLNK